MTEKNNKTDWKQNVCTRGKSDSKCSTNSAFYGLGFIGALVYYISTSSGFWNIVWGIVKAMFWPAFLVFELLKYLGM